MMDAFSGFWEEPQSSEETAPTLLSTPTRSSGREVRIRVPFSLSRGTLPPGKGKRALLGGPTVPCRNLQAHPFDPPSTGGVFRVATVTWLCPGPLGCHPVSRRFKW